MYATTLSIVLYLIYGIVNIFTGFTIIYFDVAYNAISFIYVATAILIIRNDLIKQQIEVGKIIEEQKKIKEEKRIEEKDRQKDKKEENSKKDKNKKNKQGNKNEEPEGNEA